MILWFQKMAQGSWYKAKGDDRMEQARILIVYYL